MMRARLRVLLVGNQHGVALPLAMLALVILTVLSLAFMALSKSEPIIASNQARAAAARSLAESGLERALWALTTSVIPATLSGVAAAPYNGTQFTPQPSPAGGILFYCIPHQTAGMVGRIALAGLAPPPVEKGILLRAYWIGLIGIAVTLLWVVISYYIIKSSSRHFKDHAEHVRRGLP